MRAFLDTPQSIRDKLAFSSHNVFSDAPFPSIHLVSCRNFINIIKQEGRDKLIKLIKFSLKNCGFLFIGDNDCCDVILSSFSIFDKHRIIFRSQGLSCSMSSYSERAMCLLPDQFECFYKESIDNKGNISKIISKREDSSQEFDLDVVISQLETANEILKSKIEEQQAVSEITQSSIEELQALNQELQALNSEFQFRIKDLSETANDLQSVCKIAQIGTIVIGLDFKIVKFNNYFQKIVHLAKEDIGRSLMDFSGVLPKDFFDSLKEVVENQQDFQSEITSQDGSLYLMSLSPYRNHRLEIKGIFGVFIDISYQKNKLNEAYAAKLDFQILSELSQDLVVKLTPYGSVLESNRRCENLFQIPEYPDYRFLDSILPEDRRVFEENLNLPKSNELGSRRFQIRHKLPKGLQQSDDKVISVDWSLQGNAAPGGHRNHIVAVGKVSYGD